MHGTLTLPHPSSVHVRGTAPVTMAELKRLFAWGNLPRKMRRHYLAQRGRCPYCGEILSLQSVRPHWSRVGGAFTNWDHVVPRVTAGGGHEKRNKVLSHQRCNICKGSRAPYPCELLFAEATYLIVSVLKGDHNE